MKIQYKVTANFHSNDKSDVAYFIPEEPDDKKIELIMELNNADWVTVEKVYVKEG